MLRTLDTKRVVVTAGGTREAIDPVRFIGNRSSGKMGNALALAAAELGAEVTLITAAPAPPFGGHVSVVEVETAANMHEAVLAALDTADILLMAAAVADYRPVTTSAQKLTKHGGSLNLELVPTVDILNSLQSHTRRDHLFIVGFAAETEDGESRAKEKLKQKGLDLIVLNDVGRSDIGMGSDENEVTVIGLEGVVSAILRAPKLQVAQRILEVVSERCAHG